MRNPGKGKLDGVVNDNLIFIELNKTGKSTITRLIDAGLPGETVRDKYGHTRLT